MAEPLKYTGPKHPEVKVRLIGSDGNAFTILGRCSSAARKAGLDAATVGQFVNEAMNGDYDHLLRTAMDWFDVQ